MMPDEKLMTMTCADVDKFVHPYVDGEFASEERALMDVHLAGCARCRELVTFQRTFKASLRARLHRPAPPEALRVQVLAALDRADARGDGPALPMWRRAAPVTAALTAAAAVLVMVGAALPSRADSPVVEEAIRSHEKNLPVEVGGGEDNVRTWYVGKVNVPVRPPAIHGRLLGGRLNQLRSRDVAQLFYQVGNSTATVYVFDASGIEVIGGETRVVGRRVVQLDSARGYNVLFYKERGVGYVIASDLDPEELLQALR